ncbi:MAG: adenylate/guanylate cyclase domain-containing protein [Byssovorax sp.]
MSRRPRISAQRAISLAALSEPPRSAGLPERTAVALRQALFGGTAVHAAFIPLFWALGVPALALYNVVSVLVFVRTRMLTHKGRIHLVVPLVVGEVVLHQALSVHYLGLGAGFQLWILATLPVLLLIPRDRLAVVVGGVVVSLGAFLFLAVRYDGVPPPVALAPMLLSAMRAGNEVSAFLFVSAVTYFFARTAEQAEGMAQRAHRQTEALLNNTLPTSIAARLLTDGRVLADSFDEATILFADIVGFTTLAQRTEPAALVALLDDVFSAFDDEADRLGLEKIKTIGDAYMVAAGVPVPRPDHVEAAARMALGMLRVPATLAEHHGVELSMRIGIHTGPVIAGVIGNRKFAYDLWGDTVNTAARMESHGSSGEIHVSDAVKCALEGRFDFEPRGVIEVKGKGPMKTWFLRAKSDA